MATAGLAWGIYSLWGSQGSDPTESTAKNFLYATPLALLISLVSFNGLSISWQGALLAIMSGAIWYTVLKEIQSATAAIVQLSVPALATLGGVILLAEPISLRIVLATTLTIGGIALFLTRRVNETSD
ncbi:MAG: EamA family transporter [Pseudomonadales bacterium]